MDEYYSRGEVSNSDLSWLKKRLYPPKIMLDPTEYYRFGRLIDAMLTEPEKIDYFRMTLEDEEFSREDFEKAEKMKASFLRDETGMMLLKNCKGQVVKTNDIPIQAHGIDFTIRARCKFDFWSERMGFGGDLKSTTAKTQAEFEAAARYFDYDRQRAWYMDITGADRDILIGVSKHNFRVFKIFINRDSIFYREGREKYTDLSFRWYYLFGSTKNFKTY